MKEILLPWVECGYHAFAYDGPQGLKIEPLSREIGKNKSSFYHHFADVEIFTEVLLEYHLEQAQLVAVKESQCASLEELINILVEHKTDLLFNRQLRIYRKNKAFATCFIKTSEITTNAIIGIWTEILGLDNNAYLAELVLKLSIENFYLQITDQTLNHEWLSGYFNNLRTLVKEFKKLKHPSH